MNYEKIDLLIQIALFSTVTSSIITLIIQRVKEIIKTNSNVFKYISGFLSMSLGFLFAMCFSDFDISSCCVSGLFVFGGADTIYKLLEGNKLFSSISELDKEKVVVIPKENEIK